MLIAKRLRKTLETSWDCFLLFFSHIVSDVLMSTTKAEYEAELDVIKARADYYERPDLISRRKFLETELNRLNGAALLSQVTSHQQFNQIIFGEGMISIT